MPNNSYIKFINFFKEHKLYDEEIFTYLRENSIMFDYLDTDQRPLVGTYYTFDKRQRLNKIILYVLFIKDEITIVTNIHEYTHGLLAYNNLNKKYTLKDDCEILPMLMEKIYLKENPSSTLERYIQYLDTKILESKNKEDYRYKIALDIQSELLEYYNANNDFEKLKTKSKKLYRKYNVK